MITLKQVSISFGRQTVLDSFDCTIKRGDFITIVGPNGAGKSSLFNVIAGKNAAQEGQVFFGDKEVTNQSETERARMITRLFQNPRVNCIQSMTVAQNFVMASLSRQRPRLVAAHKSITRSRILSLLTSVGLAQTIDKPMGDLSGGQQQMISFLMATLTPPELLLLDEPTAALDPRSATNLIRYAKRFIQKHSITTLMITHDPMLAIILGNKTWVIEKGMLVKEYEGQEKASLSAQDLLGHIDYRVLTE